MPFPWLRNLREPSFPALTAAQQRVTGRRRISRQFIFVQNNVYTINPKIKIMPQSRQKQTTFMHIYKCFREPNLVRLDNEWFALCVTFRLQQISESQSFTPHPTCLERVCWKSFLLFNEHKQKINSPSYHLWYHHNLSCLFILSSDFRIFMFIFRKKRSREHFVNVLNNVRMELGGHRLQWVQTNSFKIHLDFSCVYI